MDLGKIEQELKQRYDIPYKWGRKQNDDWDSLTNFIYATKTYSELVEKIKDEFQTHRTRKAISNYALNRWYNFHSAQAVEYIFFSINGVEAERDKFNKLIDFRINGIPFDHKTTVYPEGFEKDLYFALKDEARLIKWLYKTQSGERRKHFRNRLFIVLYDSNGEHWKLKAELIWLKRIITDYVNSFNENRLYRFQFQNDIKTLSDIIWGIK